MLRLARAAAIAALAGGCATDPLPLFPRVADAAAPDALALRPDASVDAGAAPDGPPVQPADGGVDAP